jgi:glycosyltransferase involved in cell wall biosynthesis
VIEAFAKTTRSVASANLVIVGGGPMRNTWIQQARNLGIENNVIFMGYVSVEKKLELLSKCSALVFPSLVEGFGLAILEAFAMSKPVMVSNIESVKELVHDGLNGFVISNPADWENKMKLLLSDETLCRAMGRSGRGKAEQNFQLAAVGEKFEAPYRSLGANYSLGAGAVAPEATPKTN